MSWIVLVRCADGLGEPVSTLAILHDSTGLAEVAARDRANQIDLTIGFDERVAADVFAAAVSDLDIEWARVEAVDTGSWAVEGLATVRFHDTFLTLEVGTAFGHGSHPTTALALAAIAATRDSDSSLESPAMLDVGCGTGVLALAAAHLGFVATGCDIDPEAVAIATRNADRNLLAANTSFVAGSPSQLAQANSLWNSAGFDLVVVNTLIGVHEEEAQAITELASPTAIVIVTGILLEQVERVRLAYKDVNFTEQSQSSGWLQLTGHRSSAA